MTAAFSPGDLVRARGREWVALPSPHEGWPALRPLSGADGERVLLRPDLELDPVRPARFDPPADAAPAMRATAALLAGAVRLALWRRAGPFRSAAQLGFEPRLCQLPALLIALRLAAPRLPIGDAVGIGNTIEARLIPDECRGMQGGRDLHAARPLGFDDMVDKAGTASRRARAKQLT